MIRILQSLATQQGTSSINSRIENVLQLRGRAQDCLPAAEVGMFPTRTVFRTQLSCWPCQSNWERVWQPVGFDCSLKSHAFKGGCNSISPKILLVPYLILVQFRLGAQIKEGCIFLGLQNTLFSDDSRFSCEPD